MSQASVRGAWIGALVVFACALGLRLLALRQIDAYYPLADRVVIDEQSYESWAIEIAEGDWIGDEVFFQEPLYPYWIGSVYRLFGPDRATLRLLQALLGAGVAAAGYGLARRLFGPLAGWVAGGALAADRALIFLPALLLKPNLFLPILAGIAWLLALGFERRGRRRAVCLGLLLGLGALLRGNVVLLLPILVAWPAAATWRARGPQAAAPGSSVVALSALTLAGVLAILGPVAVRNYAVGGVWTLTTSGAGTNVYGGNNPDNPYGRATEFDWVRGIPEYEAGDWQREAERRLGRELDAGEVSSYWLGETLDSMARDPWLHATIFWRKLRLSLGAYEVPDNHGLDWAGLHVPILSAWFPGRPLWGTLGLAGLTLFCLRCSRRRGGAALALLWLLYLGTIVATVTSMRARLPLVLLTAPFAGGFVAAVAADPRADRRRWIERGVALGLGAGTTLLPVLSPEQRLEDLDKRRYNHAVYLLEDGDELERAAEVVQGLLERRADSSRIQTLAAELSIRQAMGLQERDPAAARAGFLAARERLDRVLEQPAVSARQRFRVQTLAGALDNGLGDPVDAERHFRAAAEFDPSDREVTIGLARALLFQGRRDAAAEALRAILERGPDPEVEAILGSF